MCKDVLPQLGDAPAADALVHGGVYAVLNDARDLVVLVGDDGILPQLLHEQLAEYLLGGDAFQTGAGRKAGQYISGFFLVGLGHHFLYGGKRKGCSE